MGILGGTFRLLTLIGESDGPEVGGLSPGELREAQWILNNASEEAYDELIAGLSKFGASLRQKDSLYSKLARFGASRAQDALDAEAARQDTLFPNLAPHAAIYGPKFPRDDRPKVISGRILGVTASKVFDSGGMFGDPYWMEVDASSRLAGRHITMKSGPLKGNSYLILSHDHLAATPFILVQGDPISGANAGNRFTIDGDEIPDSDIDAGDNGWDWLLVSAIRGTLTSVNLGLSKVYCSAVFTAAGYWRPDSETIPGDLVGRTISIDGVGDRVVTAHDNIGGSVTLDDATGIAGSETFRIKSRSPFDTGAQKHGTLLSEQKLEPTVMIRLSKDSLGKVSEDTRTEITEGSKAVGRYKRLRFNKYHGTKPRLRLFQKGALERIRHYQDEKDRAGDIRAMNDAVGLDLEIP